MSAGRLGKFQTKMFSGWAPYITKLNHISTMYHSAPQQAPVAMVQLMARNFNPSIESLLSKYPTKEFESDDEYTWNVIASSRRNIPLVEARDIDGDTIGAGDTAGSDYSRFYLVFAEEYFFDGEVLHGNLNEVYPVRVIGEPKKEGTLAVYCVELINGSSEGIPGSRLQAGEKFSAEYAPVERELSRRVGGRIECLLVA